MNIAILGTGIGFEHGQRLKQIPGTELTGIWGRSPEKTQGKAAALGCRAAADHRELLNDPETELVLVCLPTDRHEEYVTEALAAGKHVFCETPLAYTSAEALRMTKAAEQAGKSLSVGLFQNFNPPLRWLSDRSDEGAFDSVELFRRTPPVWGRMRHILLDLMMHDIDTVLDLAGSAEVISARGVRDADGEWRQVTLELSTPKGQFRITGDSALPLGYPFTAGFHARRDKPGTELAADFRMAFPAGGFEFDLRAWNSSGEVAHGVEGADPYLAELVYLTETLTRGEIPTRLSGYRALAAIRIAERGTELLDRSLL